MNLRLQQQRIAEYDGGLLAVSAVPGSGKTHTLAALVVSLLKRRRLNADQDILVVTFTNSAVENIKARIRRMLADERMPDGGYRVFTLHSLANSIIRERPDLAGTTNDFRIDDELSGKQAMPEAARWFTQQEPAYWQSFLPPDLTKQSLQKAEDQWRETTTRLGYEVTKLAKNLRLSATEIKNLILRNDSAVTSDIIDSNHQLIHSSAHPTSPFLRIGAAIYERYEKILAVGGRLDFDDLIWGAIRCLENDDDFRARLSLRYPFILEDEAQDSTPLQETILKMLSRDHGNWVRVGDPNQAIMTTFTASDVRFFRAFLKRDDVKRMPLSVSGRSGQKIINLANDLALWSSGSHPETEVRAEALSADVLISPTEPGDEQHAAQTQATRDARIHVQAFSDEAEEADRIAKSAAKFAREHEDKTCAVLVPTNNFGRSIVDALESLQAKYPERVLYQDQLRNAQPVRDVSRVLAQATKFCAAPTNMNALVELRDAVSDVNPKIGFTRKPRVKALMRSAQPERLLFPSPLAEPPLSEKIELNDDERQELERVASLASKWLRASALPIDQLILTIAQDTLVRENDLAIAHSLAVSLRRYASINPIANLIDFARELDEIASNRQKYLSNALIESGFEPTPGMVTVTTMHKAKGLEWDRVYLTCIDEMEFPHDADAAFRGEQWYLGGHDPATEARLELMMLVNDDSIRPSSIVNRRETSPMRRVGGSSLRDAHLEYIAERMRLLYVGVTRARSELMFSYSKSRFGKETMLAFAVQEVARNL
jgi:DNA helicase-2/ATP-dependent DNA helicase PcrA